MTENVDLQIVARAEDEASPVLRRLLRDLRRFERLGAKLTAKPAVAFGLSRDAEKALAAHRRVAAVQKQATTASAKAVKATDASLRRQLAFADRMQTQKANEVRQQQAITAKALRDRLSFEAAMGRQKAQERRVFEADSRRRDAAIRRADSMTGKRLVERLRFSDRMNRQRIREERSAASENRRQDAAARREERQHRAHLARIDRQHRAQRRETFRNAGRGYDGIHDATGAGGTAGLAVGAGTAVAARRILVGEMAADSAEKNLQSYGGMTPDAARAMRTDWATRLSIDLGSTVADMLTGATEALKLGIPQAGSKDFAKLSIQAAEAWDLPVKDVQDTLGNINSILTAAGEKFSGKRLAGITNEIQHLAAGMSTTPAKLLEFFKQGAGGASMLGMSMESALAFGAASTSLGNKAGESGTLLDYTAGRLIAMPQIAKRHGIEGKQVRDLIGSLGYGNAAEMDRQRRADPDAFIFDFIERFGKIKNPKKRDEAVRAFASQEWFGEFGRLTTGGAQLRQARQLQKESQSVDAIGKHWRIHTQKLEFVAKQARSALGVLAGEMGMILEPLAKDGLAFLTTWATKSADALRVNFWAATRGLVEGFLGRPGQMRDLLAQWFGAGGMVADPKKLFDFFKGLAEGLKQVWAVVSGIMSGIGKMLGIDTASPEGAGKLAGLLLGGSIAAKLAPTDLVGGAAKSAGGLAGLVGNLLGIGGGAAVGGVAGGALAGAAAKVLPQVAVVGTVGVEVLNWMADRGSYDRKSVQRFGEAGGGVKGVAEMGVLGAAFLALRMWRKSILGDHDPANAKASADELRQEMRSLGDTLDSSALIQKAALERAGLYRDLIVPAAFGGSARLGGFARSTPSAGALTGADTASALTTSTPGAALPAFGIGRSGSIIGRGSGGMGMLDAIARAEGTAGRGDYEAVLGYGKYGKPSKPITQMTLNEAFAFGRQIKGKHGSSSAIGRYQIVGNTMKDAAAALGMDMNTTRFDASTQDRMAQWIAQRQGLGAWEGFKRHPGELATAKAAMNGGGPAAPGAQAGAVDNAMRFLGASENGPGRGAVNSLMQSAGYNIDSARTAWCAGFVNSNLAAMGITGTGSLTASSFLGWGEKIDPRNAVKGDVLLEHRGRRAGETGAHVGMATGERRIGPNGQEQLEMISGNSGPAGQGAVRKTWENASGLAVRRAISGVPQNAQSITSGVPAAVSSAGPGGRAGGPGGGPVTINPTITINGAGQSPEKIAAAVNREIGKAANSSTFDIAYL